MTDQVVMPLFYWSTSRGSDAAWIQSKIQQLPQSEQQSVADQYVRLYGNSRHAGDRKAANTYLHEQVLKHQNKDS